MYQLLGMLLGLSIYLSFGTYWYGSLSIFLDTTLFFFGWLLKLSLEPTTKDKLGSLGVISILIFALCNQDDETLHHLFFECSFSPYVWLLISQLCCVPMGPNRDLKKYLGSVLISTEKASLMFLVG